MDFDLVDLEIIQILGRLRTTRARQNLDAPGGGNQQDLLFVIPCYFAEQF